MYYNNIIIKKEFNFRELLIGVDSTFIKEPSPFYLNLELIRTVKVKKRYRFDDPDNAKSFFYCSCNTNYTKR